MNEIVKHKVEAVFRKVFVDPALNISPEYTAQDVQGWDSLTHMNLISELEDYFSIVFTFEEVNNFKNIGDMINLISEKIK